MILGPLKVRSAPMDEWILQKANIESFDYNIETWIGETIFTGMRRHQNAKCFNCGRMEHLRRNGRQGIPRNNISSGNGKNRTQPSGICRRCGKGQHWTNKYRSTKDRQGNQIPPGNFLRGLLQATKSKVVQSLSVTVEDMSHQEI